MKVTSILGKVALLVAVLAAFVIGLFGTIRLSLYNPTVEVPNVVGKDKATAEAELAGLGLNLKARMTRYVPDKQPNTILDQSPLPGAKVKKGLPIGVVIARAPKEGEAPDENANSDEEDITANENGNANTGSANSTAPATKKPVNKNTNKNANARNKNSNKNSNSNTANKNANANAANVNKNANANVNNANKGNTNTVNKGVNANTKNSNRRVTPEP